MTDDELAKLKPGDRVLVPLAPSLVPPGGNLAVECEVLRIDRRFVHLREPTQGLEIGRTAGELSLVPASADSIPDDLALRSLESRWRALTDEVLVAIKACVADGIPLGEIAVMFNATDDIACAEILAANEAATLEMGGLVTCAVGVTERVHRG